MATTFSTIVTASTSLILIDTQTYTNPIVYLSSLNSPNSIVTIRDTTGGLSATNKLLISTTKNISLFGTNPSSIQLTTPYSFISLTPNTTSQWTILNTFNVSENSAVNTTTANISTATISTFTSRILSTAQLVTSSLGVGCNQPSYTVDVAGTVNAQAFYLNGNLFELNGRYSTIQTSTLLINQTPTVGLPNMAIGSTYFYSKKPAAGGAGSNNIYLDSNGILLNDSLYIPPSSIPPSTSFIGINTSSPTTHLDVNGTIQASLFLQRNVPFNTGLSTGSLSISSTTLFINGAPLIINNSNLGNVLASTLLVNPTNPNTFGTILNTSTLQIGLLSTLGNINVGGSVNVGQTIVLYNQTNPAVSTVLSASATGSLLVNSSTLQVTLGQVSTIGISSMKFINDLNAPITVNGNLFINSSNTLSRWVVVGSDSASNVFKTSTDGLTWTNATPTANGTQAFAVGYNGQIWLTAVSDATLQGTTFYTSSNGTSWTQITATGNYPELAVYGIEWTGNQWLVAGATLLNDSYTVARSPNGIAWTPATGTALATQARGIAFDGRRAVAVGQSGIGISNIRYSDTNGQTWLNTNKNFSVQGNGVTTNKKIWVAVGQDTVASIQYSLDGIFWLPASNGFSTSGNAVAWNGTVFVTVGQDSTATIKYSYNGIQWSNATGTFDTSSQGGRGIAWNGSLWVATGYDSTSNARIKTSPDGITWTNSSSGSHATASFAASFSSNVIPNLQIDNLSFFGKNQWPSWTSTNTINTTQSSIVINNTLAITQTRVGINCNIPSFTLDVNGTLNASTFLINGSTLTTSGQVASSINVSTIFPMSSLTQVTTLGLVARAASNNPYELNINDSLLFTTSSAITLPSSSVFFANSSSLSLYVPNQFTIDGFLAAQNTHTSNLWVSVGLDANSNFIKYSSDGSTWQNATGATFTNAYQGFSIAFNGRFWLASISDNTTNNATFFRSDSGTAWTQVTTTGTFPNGAVRSMIWTGNQYVAVGSTSSSSNTTISRSSNGINWTAATTGGFNTSSGGRGVAFDGRRLVAVGNFTSSSNETIQFSDDLGTNWTTVGSNGFSISGRGITTNGRIWVAVGRTSGNSNASIKYSFNGSNWTNIASNGFDTIGVNVAWNGYRFVAVGQDTGGQNIKYSDDGITWSNATSGLFSSGTQATSITWNGSLWVAGGDDGTSNARFKTSPNGLVWTNSVSGAFNGNPTTIAFSSNVFPDFSINDLEIYGKSQPAFYTSTNKIFLQTSTININNSLIVAQPTPSASFSNPTIDLLAPTTARNSLLVQSTLGINTQSPLSILDITQPFGTFNYPVLRNSIANDINAKNFLSNFPGSNVTCYPVNTGNLLNFYYRDTTSIYRVQLTGASFFTGQHANVSIDPRLTQESLSSCVGLIVKSADKGYISYKPDGTRVTGKDAIWITEALPIITLTDTDKDPCVWGVVTHHQNDNWTTSNTRELDTNPTWANSLRGRIRINGVGEGAIWVTNSAGNITNGDYICSSAIPGYGRKQDDDILHNYTVAKATMSCDFNLQSTRYQCEEIPGTPFRRAFIGCSYHSS